MKPRMAADIVMGAPTIAWFQRRPAPGLMHHSDRGRQYTSGTFQARLHGYDMVRSMSRRGNCWHNAPTMSFFNSPKNERVQSTRCDTQTAA